MARQFGPAAHKNKRRERAHEKTRLLPCESACRRGGGGAGESAPRGLRSLLTGELRAPKTKAGTRFVSLPPMVLAELKRWKLACPPCAQEFVFPNNEGGARDDRNFRSRVFDPALRPAGLRRVRVHDLRHTAASILIAAGADLADVSRQLGHANVSITLSVYTHHFQKRGACDLGARIAEFVARETDVPSLCPVVDADRSAA